MRTISFSSHFLILECDGEVIFRSFCLPIHPYVRLQRLCSRLYNRTSDDGANAETELSLNWDIASCCFLPFLLRYSHLFYTTENKSWVRRNRVIDRKNNKNIKRERKSDDN